MDFAIQNAGKPVVRVDGGWLNADGKYVGDMRSAAFYANRLDADNAAAKWNIAHADAEPHCRAVVDTYRGV